jgi:membrane-associated protease RseP (regulator of RpoE activity)
VKIVGMTPLDEIAPEDEPRAFYKQGAGKKAIVLAAGSTVHFIIGIGLILGSAMAIGKPFELAPGIRAVSECVTPSGLREATCAEPGAVPSPALAADLEAGDVVVAVDGAPVAGYVEFLRAVRAAPGRPLDLTVERDGQRRDLTLTPVPVQRESLDREGVMETVGAIGVAPKLRQDYDALGPVAAVGYTGDTLVLITEKIAATFTEKLGTIADVYGPDRDKEGFIGVVGASRLSGEVAASEETLTTKVAGFLLLVASLNLFIGVFNLLPLLPLDGGHLAVLGYETARDKVRRLFGYRGEVQRVDFTKLLPLTYAVVLLFAGFTLFLLGADIVNPITLN